MTKRAKRRLILLGLIALGVGTVAFLLPSIGASLILYPLRLPVVAAPPAGCQEVSFRGDDVNLQGWKGKATGKRRATLIYLHGVSDNRAGSAGVMEHFREQGFDVIAYDSRAHGESEGEAATFGFYEKKDLRRVIDTVESGPVVVIGCSLGGAVALQTAAEDPRITAVVAAESFSDLRTLVKERAPAFLTAGAVDRAIALAERKGDFQMDAVSPSMAAKSIMAPVLLIHGDADTETPPDHSRRIFAALNGPKQLILVPGAGHNHSVQGQVWEEVEQWLDRVLAGRGSDD